MSFFFSPPKQSCFSRCQHPIFTEALGKHGNGNPCCGSISCVFVLAHSDSRILAVNIYGKYLLLLAFAAVYFLSAVESHAEKTA